MQAVETIQHNGKTFKVSDKVLYIPNHADGNPYHMDCEIGIVTRLEADGRIWVRYENQHKSQPGKLTPAKNLVIMRTITQ